MAQKPEAGRRLLEENYTLSEWAEIERLAQEMESMGGWIYRGQGSKEDLQTSLERALQEFEIPRSESLAVERNLILEFQRKAYRYLDNPPPDNDILEWLALMRHYGAPTRLLDWTYSFWVALYFAVAESTDDSLVWGINLNWLNQAFHNEYPEEQEILAKDPFLRNPAHFSKLLLSERPSVICVMPFRLDERLTIQQSVFLVPGSLTRNFRDNLRTYPSSPDPSKKLVRLLMRKNLRGEAMRHLYRMNMSSATLFPGLDGFAKSMKMILPLRYEFWPEMKAGSRKKKKT